MAVEKKKTAVARPPARAPLDVAAAGNGAEPIRRAWPMTPDGRRFAVAGMSPKNKKRLVTMLSDPDLRRELEIPGDVAPLTLTPATTPAEEPKAKGFPDKFSDQGIQAIGFAIVLVCDKLKLAAVETIAPYVVFDKDVRKELAPAVSEAIDYNWPGLADMANPNMRLAIALVTAIKQNVENVENRRAGRTAAAPTSIS